MSDEWGEHVFLEHILDKLVNHFGFLLWQSNKLFLFTDADDFEPPSFNPKGVVSDKWEGEDEDQDVKVRNADYIYHISIQNQLCVTDYLLCSEHLSKE